MSKTKTMAWPIAPFLNSLCFLILAGLCAVLIGCGVPAERRYPTDPAYEAKSYSRDAGTPQAMLLVSSSATQSPYDRMNANDFSKQVSNSFKNAKTDPLSTFSIDVDTASYTMARRFINEDAWPPAGTIRLEEMINFFPYAYEAPGDGSPCNINTEQSEAFWNPGHRLLRIGVKAKDIDWSRRKPSNLVFLIDVSGSMFGPQRLGLVQKSMNMLTQNLDKRDKVTIVTYSGNAGVALPPTSGDQHGKITEVINSLQSGGSTQGSAGITTAYKMARKNFIKGGINRIILCTDGDFNVGLTSKADLLDLIKKEAQSDVFLSVFGYGMGNYKDDLLVKLADSGNGMYGYIDTELEARRLLVEQVGATLIAVAKDVKIQVEFNPALVDSYRLIGYEKRILAHEDFNDDSKDAGEMGAGHTVTALYEIVPKGLGEKGGNVDPLKYSTPNQATNSFVGEMATVKVRYKEPEGSQSRLISQVVQAADYSKSPSADFRMASAVAAFGMILDDSPYKGRASFDQALKIVSDPAVSNDDYRRDFVELIKKASSLKKPAK